METTPSTPQSASRPNILILCMDQWDAHMEVPGQVQFPAMQRLEAQGVSFDRQYCTTPICTPSRASMWTGVHAKNTGLWDNTNMAWIDQLSHEVLTIGQMLREQGYYTAFKGKWHLSPLAMSEDALEDYGFSDYQQWGDMYGAPLEGEKLDGTAAFQTVDWLETKGAKLEQPWLMVCSLVNPHDIMFFQSDPAEKGHPKGAMTRLMTHKQRLGWFEQDWDVGYPANFDDDLQCQPYGVHHYKENIEINYGRIPDDRPELWLERRNYLINCMRLVDYEFNKILEALDRLELWDNTVVIFTSDHGEMNGAHHMAQKGSITFDEAAIVNFTVCAPGAPRGQRTAAVGSHLDLAPTLLEFSGLSPEEMHKRYPKLKGRSLRDVIFNPQQPGPRGSETSPGDGALICWDGLSFLDNDWALSGALRELVNMDTAPAAEPVDQQAKLHEAGQKYGAPDFKRRTFYRLVVDGQYKLVRWFSPEEYGMPSTVEELYQTSDVGLYDLINDPGELENLGHPNHPKHDPALVQRMLDKLNALIRSEVGEDHPPFDLNMFGTRKVKYRKSVENTDSTD